ncbi:hypothetical protein E8E13_008078 [Curvularia kusanoi]|uniref:Uncharacterized protein n=1 Tax=Curvularia kusanoi TaxID=90978 RepID=A0A9P4T9G3_CURKU|nr:hypothetical protein E8E13_008078 [Curvularia kusanoi]
MFVDNQMYFRCQTSRYAEDLIDPTNNYTDPLDSESFGGSLLPLYVKLEEPVQDWGDILMYYSERTFSNQNDVQLAMAGITRRVSERMKCPFFQRLPTATFDVFFLFHTQSMILRKRRGFPSYTWTGWIGRVICDNSTETNDWLRFHTWIIWYKRSSAGITNPIWDIVANDSFPAHDESVLGYRERSGFGVRHCIQSLRTTPSDNPISSRDPPDYPMLQFWTMALDFTISWSDVMNGTAYVLDRSGIKCGKVAMDGLEDDGFF